MRDIWKVEQRAEELADSKAIVLAACSDELMAELKVERRAENWGHRRAAYSAGYWAEQRADWSGVHWVISTVEQTVDG